MKDFSLFCFLLLLLPLPAFAEVSDKVASIPQLWITAAVAGSVAFLAGRYRFVLGVVLFPISLLLILSVLEPVLDPFVGPAIVLEQGRSYLVAAYGSIALLLALHVAGLWLSWRHKHRTAG